MRYFQYWRLRRLTASRQEVLETYRGVAGNAYRHGFCQPPAWQNDSGTGRAGRARIRRALPAQRPQVLIFLNNSRSAILSLTTHRAVSSPSPSHRAETAAGIVSPVPPPVSGGHLPDQAMSLYDLLSGLLRVAWRRVFPVPVRLLHRPFWAGRSDRRHDNKARHIPAG